MESAGASRAQLYPDSLYKTTSSLRVEVVAIHGFLHVFHLDAARAASCQKLAFVARHHSASVKICTPETVMVQSNNTCPRLVSVPQLAVCKGSRDFGSAAGGIHGL